MGENFWERRRVSWGKFANVAEGEVGGENLTKPFRRVDLRKESELSHAGDIKGPARLSGDLYDQ